MASSHPSRELRVALCGEICCSLLGQVKKTAGRVQQAPKQRKPPWFMCAAGPEDGKSPKQGCSVTGVEVVWQSLQQHRSLWKSGVTNLCYLHPLLEAARRSSCPTAPRPSPSLPAPPETVGEEGQRNHIPAVVCFCITGSLSCGPVEDLCSCHVFKKPLFSLVFLSYVTSFLHFRTPHFLSTLIYLASPSLSYGTFLFLIGTLTLPQSLEGILANVVFFSDYGPVIILA